MHALLKPLARRLRVQSGRIVTAIEYDERTDEAVVRFVRRPRTRPKRAVGPNGEEVREEVGEVESVRAHSVCCCLPLGVLRERPLPYARPAVDRAGVHLPNVRFEPSLPAATRALIQTAAAGSANKIVLVFKRRFWPDGVFFGRVNDKPCARGEFFLFSATPGGTVLNAWLSGAAANLSDSFSSNDLHTRVMKVLARMFGPECPKLPEQVIVTRWHEDEQTYGCFPYVRVGRSDEDFAALAQPVFVPLAAASSQEAALARPFLHFAGDHTSREFPGRLHGAFLSGLREAARIADYHLGAVNAPANQAEFERLGRLLADRLQPPKPDGRAHSED